MKKDTKFLLIGCLSVFAIVMVVTISVLALLAYFVGSTVKSGYEISEALEANEQKAETIKAISYNATSRTAITEKRYIEFIEMNQEVSTALEEMGLVEGNREFFANSDNLDQMGMLETLGSAKSFITLMSKGQEAYFETLIAHDMSGQEFYNLQFLTWMSLRRAEKNSEQGYETVWSDYLSEYHNINSAEQTTTKTNLQDISNASFMNYSSVLDKEETDLTEENYQLILPYLNNSEFKEDLANTSLVSEMSNATHLGVFIPFTNFTQDNPSQNLSVTIEQNIEEEEPLQ